MKIGDPIADGEAAHEDPEGKRPGEKKAQAEGNIEAQEEASITEEQIEEDTGVAGRKTPTEIREGKARMVFQGCLLDGFKVLEGGGRHRISFFRVIKKLL